MEELLKEKDNQVDIARTKLSAVQAQTFSSEGTVTSLEEALADRDKQINQLREQRDRAEKDNKEEKVNAVKLKILIYTDKNIIQMSYVNSAKGVSFFILFSRTCTSVKSQITK